MFGKQMKKFFRVFSIIVTILVALGMVLIYVPFFSVGYQAAPQDTTPASDPSDNF